MKFKEITDSKDSHPLDKYLASKWESLAEVLSSTLQRVMNYVFVLNSGALLATLTYIAAKQQVTRGVHFAIWGFVVGTILITVHAAADYYGCRNQLRRFRRDIDSFVKNEIDWEVLADRDNERRTGERIWHLLGWFSAVAFLIGLFVGIDSICRRQSRKGNKG